jgi:hypothetical protein
VKSGDWIAYRISVMAPGDVIQSLLSPAGLQAASIHRLWSLMLWVSIGVFVLVLIFVFLAIRAPAIF